MKKLRIIGFVLSVVMTIGILGTSNILVQYDSVSAAGKSDKNETKYDFSKTKIGEYITFGSYEQDGNISNGKEPIEWLVLSKNNKEMLLLSKYALEYLPYNDTNYYPDGDDRYKKPATWETCLVRKFLNNDFYDSAFSKEEKKLIKTTVLNNSTKMGDVYIKVNDTKDNVFLLHYDDVINKKYGFSKAVKVDDIYRRCALTPYAEQIANSRWKMNHTSSDYMTEDGDFAYEWCLRNLGSDESFVSVVTKSGSIYTMYPFTNLVKTGQGYGIRPALYIDMSSFKVTDVENLLENRAELDKKKVKISKKNFSDSGFREVLRDEVDKNGDGWLSKREMDSVEKLEVRGSSGKHIKNLNGIEKFKNLKILNLFNVNIKNLDLSNIPTLVNLYIYEDKDLKSLNLNGCTELTDVNLRLCYNIGKIDFTKNSALRTLRISSAKLKELDLSDCVQLESIEVSGQQIKYLEIGNGSKLTDLVCNNTSVEKLNLKDCTLLQKLDCKNNKLKELDLSNSTQLEYLDCSGNEITSLNVRGLISLKTFNCSLNDLSELDISGNTVLNELNCDSNGIERLSVNSEMKKLDCSNNKLDILDLDNVQKLEVLYCSGNNLIELDLSKCIELLTLDCSTNSFDNLNFSKCKKLRTLNCSGNHFANLDISQCPDLSELICYDNDIDKLDLSNCKELFTLECSNNKIKSLDLKNCNGL